MNRKRLTRSLAVAALLAGVIGFTPGIAGADDPDPNECPGHQGLDANDLTELPAKINEASHSETVDGVEISWGGEPGSISFTNTNDTDTTVVWCAKGGTNFDGEGNRALQGQQETTIAPGETESFGPFGTAISHVVIYSVEVTEVTVEHDVSLECVSPNSGELTVTITGSATVVIMVGGTEEFNGVVEDDSETVTGIEHDQTVVVTVDGEEVLNEVLDCPPETTEVTPQVSAQLECLVDEDELPDGTANVIVTVTNGPANVTITVNGASGFSGSVETQLVHGPVNHQDAVVVLTNDTQVFSGNVSCPPVEVGGEVEEREEEREEETQQEQELAFTGSTTAIGFGLGALLLALGGALMVPAALRKRHTV